MITDYTRLSGLQKVAILFSVLGESLALTLFKDLNKTDIRKVRACIREMDSVSFAVKKHVIEQFYFSFVSEKFQSEEEDQPRKPFEFLNSLTDEQLIALVQTEEPRVVAIALAQVEQTRRMMVLTRLRPEIKGRVLIELGELTDVPLEAMVEVANDLQEKAHFLPRTIDLARGGGKDIAEILGELDPKEEEKFLEAIMMENPELAKEVKKYHLTFEDIFTVLPNNLLRDLMNSVELDTVALALKGVDEEIVERVIENLPQKKQAMYEPVEGAVAKREIDSARKAIVQAARKMEKDGAFNLADLTGSEEMVE